MAVSFEGVIGMASARRPGVLGLVTAAFALLVTVRAEAGGVEGPYLVWMNLGTVEPQLADAHITAVVNGQQRLCWPEGALLYMRHRPPGITPALVRLALQQREAPAQRRLRQLLRQPFDNLPGFDGVVAYGDHGVPRLMSLGASGPVRAEGPRSASGEEAWAATFCRLLPPVSRGP
jgi:hypothetical protein